MGLTFETRMPVHHITKANHKTKSAFPSPEKHIEMANKWRPSFNVTVSSFNSVHHKSQREYFDRPI